MPLQKIGQFITKIAPMRSLAIQVFRMLVAAATPTLAELLREKICALQQQAYNTENPYDDALMNALVEAFDLEDCRVEPESPEADQRAAQHFGKIEDHGVTLNEQLEVTTPQDSKSNGQ